MDQKTTGLILRTRPLTETSLIVLWLTRDFGRIATVAKGARRPKSGFKGKLDLFYLADMTFYQSRRSELHTLREASVREHHEPLRHDLSRLRHAAYFVQLIEQSTEINTPLPGIFELLADFLARISVNSARPENLFAFELRLLAKLGFEPDLTRADLSLQTREILARLANGSLDIAASLRMTPAQSGEADRFLHGFLGYHLDRIPPARAPALHAAS